MGEAPVVSDDDGHSHELLLAQIRELYGRIAYTHKAHEIQADLCYGRHRTQRRWLIGLTAISSGTFLASLLGIALSEQWASLFISFIALAVTAVNLGTQNFQYGEEVQQHRDTAAKLWNVRESYLSLITDIQSGACLLDDGIKRRDLLQEQHFAILSDAPRTTREAYETAQDRLQNKEDLTFSEKEIDALLPTKLRKADGGGNEDK